MNLPAANPLAPPLANVNWLNTPLDITITQNHLHQIADDFFLGKNNSLGKNKTPIEFLFTFDQTEKYRLL